MKKLLLLCAILATAILCLASCKPDAHVHSYGEWETRKPATCNTDGERARYCSCGEKQTEVIYATGIHTEVIDEAVAPTCTETGLTEGKHCSTCGEVLIKQETINAGHILADGKCENCDYTYSVGLEFTSNDDGTCYVSSIGTCTDTDIVIPPTSPDGDSVTSICDWAFFHCDSLISVVIPDSVTNIGVGAFSDCYSLTSVVIPNNVITIGDYVFHGCISLTSVVIPDSVTSIGECAFFLCDNLTSVVFPDSVTSIGVSAFFGCISLTSVAIPDSVTTIGNSTFSACSSLTSVVIPDSVTTIGNDAFESCYSLKDVYYTGSEAEWSEISVGYDNNDLLTATIHFNYLPEE